MKTIKIKEINIGNDQPFVLMAGLNVLEDEKTIHDVITKCIASTQRLGTVSYTHLTLPTIYSV